MSSLSRGTKVQIVGGIHEGQTGIIEQVYLSPKSRISYYVDMPQIGMSVITPEKNVKPLPEKDTK